MASTPNNTQNVSVGKGAEGGYFFLAPAGTALPTDYQTPLDEAFLNQGFISEDGVTFSDSSNADSFYDMNGDTIETASGSVEKTYNFTLSEMKRDTLSLVMGAGNVTDADGVITAHDKGPNDATYVGVFEFVLKNGRKWRRVIPSTKISELGDMVVTYSEIVSREVTMAALKDAATGDYYTDYMGSTETVANPNPAVVPVASVTLDKATASVEAGKDVALTATVEPDTATDKTVTAESGDETKATVSVKGATVTVRGVAATAEGKPVTVTVRAGSKTATCAVTVTAPAATK